MPLYSRLTREQRYTIDSMIRNGCQQKDIAAMIGVAPSTVSRELRRVGMSHANYRFAAAQRHAQSRKGKGRRVDPALLALAGARLRQDQWSPQQISRRLAKEGLGRISHETIYRHVYDDKRAGGDLHRHLRHPCKSYRKRSAGGRERRGRLKDQVMIDQRPAIVEERSRIGDWEVDTVIGKPGGPVLVTLVERTSRYTVIARTTRKGASEVAGAILGSMRGHRERVLTLTFDNGKEFAFHARIGQLLAADAYFAHPYHAWERGLNENTNGLLRQYFPKGTDLARVTSDQILLAQDKLNSRPRKCLDYATPNEIFLPPPPIALAG